MSINDQLLDTDFLNQFSKVFEYHGVDIKRYKTSFLKRRVERRMRILDLLQYSDYISVLKNNNDEFKILFESLSINVTNFFRDPFVYHKFEQMIIPLLRTHSEKTKKIRMWSAGCATGEEPYSLALLLNESLGISNISIEIVANDINSNAIEIAQAGRYSAKSIENLPTNLISKYFTKVDTSANPTEYEIAQVLKNTVSFRTGDIISNDAKNLDVIFCRNVLIYYEKEAQDLLMSKFHNCLRDSGYLVLGMDETMLGKRCEKLFHPMLPKERIYQKLPKEGSST